MGEPLSTIDPRADLALAAKHLNEFAKDNFDNPEWGRVVAREITDTIILGIKHYTILPDLIKVQDADFNERVLVKETKGVKVWFVSKGGFVESTSLKTDVIEIPRFTMAFHVTEMEDKLRTNFAETQAVLVELGVQRSDATVYQWLYTTICAAVPENHRYADIFVGANLDTAISEVRDAGKDFECTILGREAMVNLIKDNKNFLPETNVDLLRKGLVGSYWGARVVVLRNYANETGAFFPANEFVVLGREAAHWVWFGGPITHEWLVPAEGNWHFVQRRDAGLIVHRANRIRRVICTSLPAEPK